MISDNQDISNNKEKICVKPSKYIIGKSKLHNKNDIKKRFKKDRFSFYSKISNKTAYISEEIHKYENYDDNTLEDLFSCV